MMSRVEAVVFFACLLQMAAGYQQVFAGSGTADSAGQSKTELLPFVSYDSDAGMGYGMKLFALNHLQMSESFDVILFNSTKGERWYRLVYSIPDFEVRQGTRYPWAFDLVIDYDKWIAYDFFGIGNEASVDAQETYTREPIEVSLTLSRGFTDHIVGQLGVKYRTVRNEGFSRQSTLVKLPPELNASTATAGSLVATVRYDTRNSFVNPSSGIVAQGETEVVPHTGLSNVSFTRLAAWFQNYSEPFPWKITVASRLGLQGLIGEDIPVQFLLPIGGNRTLRGYSQDRFLDRMSAVGNLEVRFPVVWRIGGVAGVDAGKVWHTLDQLDLARWAVNPVVGLRLCMDTFIARMDLGFGKETTGLYLNFGQLF